MNMPQFRLPNCDAPRVPPCTFSCAKMKPCSISSHAPAMRCSDGRLTASGVHVVPDAIRSIGTPSGDAIICIGTVACAGIACSSCCMLADSFVAGEDIPFMSPMGIGVVVPVSAFDIGIVIGFDMSIAAGAADGFVGAVSRAGAAGCVAGFFVDVVLLADVDFFVMPFFAIAPFFGGTLFFVDVGTGVSFRPGMTMPAIGSARFTADESRGCGCCAHRAVASPNSATSTGTTKIVEHFRNFITTHWRETAARRVGRLHSDGTLGGSAGRCCHIKP
jgi:hypothetical protein